MGRTELAVRFIVTLVTLGSMSCAANTSDDSTGAAGAASAGAPSSAGGDSSAGGAPSGTAGAGTSTAGSGTAGAPSTGTAGAGSSTCPGLDPADMISDFESGKADVIAITGRGGSWFLFDDGTGMQTPVKTPNVTLVAEAGGACNSMFGFHSTGTGFTVFGAGFGADFAPKVAGALDSTVYDASAYSGVALSVKATVSQDLRVSVSDGNTAVEGKVCTDTTVKTDKTRCGDYHGTDIPALTTAWTDYVLPFAAMKQRGFGMPFASIDKSKVYTIRAQIKGSVAVPGAYDIWIDNVRFVK